MQCYLNVFEKKQKNTKKDAQKRHFLPCRCLECMLLKQKIACTTTEEPLFRVSSVTRPKTLTEKVLNQTSALGEAEISLRKSNYSSHLTLLCLICKVTSVNYLPSVAQTSVLNGPVDFSELSVSEHHRFVSYLWQPEVIERLLNDCFDNWL